MTASLLALALLPDARAASIAAPAIIAGPDAGAATADPAAIHYNPGAIGATEGVHVLMDTQAAIIGIEATATRNEGIDPNTGEAYDPITADVVVPVALIGVTWKVIPERLAVGFAMSDPFVGGGKYNDEEGEPNLTSHGRYHGVNVELLSAAFTPAVAVTVVDGLHVGGGVTYAFDSVKALQAADPIGSEGLSPTGEPYGYDVLLDAEGTGGHWGWNAGVFFDRYEKLQVGLSYAGGATFQAEGEATVDVPAGLASEAEAISVPGKFGFTMQLPPIARAYVSSQLDEKLRVGAGVDYEMWNVCCGTEEGDVVVNLTNESGEPLGLEDGISIEIAEDQYNPSRLWNAASFVGYGGYQATEDLWVGARAQYNQNAVPDYSVNAVNLDFQNVGVQAGARYRLGETLTLGLSYSHFFLFTREITDSAWDKRDGNERFSPELPFKTNANGTYSGAANAVGLRVAADF